ncbi:MAG: NAD(P)/FAD-dependent oxidoreductase [Phycisphaerales bacterium]
MAESKGMAGEHAGGTRPVVVVVGGGFGGLTCVRRLKRAPVDVVLIDRRNHHLFQPLLYQVATAALSPAQISHPLRSVLETQRNARVLMAEASRVDLTERRVQVTLPDGEDRRIAYDYLVLAAGLTHSYFGHHDWEAWAPGLKTLADALEVRRRFLISFERAEALRVGIPTADVSQELTFVVIGGGPTGVEMAGAFVEIACQTMRHEFRSIDTSQARVVLIEAQSTLLPAGFPEELGRRALRDLERLGVNVMLSTRVTAVEDGGIKIRRNGASEDEWISSRTVVWAAGVRGEHVAGSLGVELDRSGRVGVGSDLSLPKNREVFVIGDLAIVMDRATGRPVPGMAPGAMQMGRFVASAIAHESRGKPRGEFRYRDKGSLATIGRARAVARLPIPGFKHGMNFGGMLAWVLWAMVHVAYLISYRARILVMLEWAWSYVWLTRGARILQQTGPQGPRNGTT